MRKLIIPAILAATVLLAGCVPMQPKPHLNSLQIQAMQTQDFTAAKKKSFNAVMTVLQNDGYVIQTADYNTGFITGKSPTQNSGWGNTQSTLTVTAFLTRKKKTVTHIRLNYVRHTVTHRQHISYSDSTQIVDTGIYTKTFNAIRQQLFVAGALN